MQHVVGLMLKFINGCALHSCQKYCICYVHLLNAVFVHMLEYDEVILFHILGVIGLNWLQGRNRATLVFGIYGSKSNSWTGN